MKSVSRVFYDLRNGNFHGKVSGTFNLRDRTYVLHNAKFGWFEVTVIDKIRKQMYDGLNETKQS